MRRVVGSSRVGGKQGWRRPWGAVIAVGAVVAAMLGPGHLVQGLAQSGTIPSGIEAAQGSGATSPVGEASLPGEADPDPLMAASSLVSPQPFPGSAQWATSPSDVAASFLASTSERPGPSTPSVAVSGSFSTMQSMSTAGSIIVPLPSPRRIHDSRQGRSGVPILSAGLPLGSSDLTPLAAHLPRTLVVAGRQEMPAGVLGVVLNVTVTEPSSAGYLTVWPDGEGAPLASNLNFDRHQTVGGLVVSAVRHDRVSIMSTATSAEVVVDLFGYLLPNDHGAMVDLDPVRLADTRDSQPLGWGESRTLLYVQRPSTYAVLLNVTVTEPTTPTFVAVGPSGAGWSGTSNLNVGAGGTAANLVLAPVGADGGVTFLNDAGRAHVVVDVMAVFDLPLAGTEGRVFPVSPRRFLDTRDGTPEGRTIPITAGETVTVPVAGTGGVPTGAARALITLTSTEATEQTYLTAWASGQPKPFVSNVNPQPGRDIPNVALVPIGADGRIAIFNAAGTVHVVVDVLGYAEPLRGIGAPVRVTAVATENGAEISWRPPISPRGVVATQYYVRVNSPDGPTRAATFVPGTARSVRLSFSAGVDELLEAWVAPSIEHGATTVHGAATGVYFRASPSLSGPTGLQVMEQGLVPVLRWLAVPGVVGYEVAALSPAGSWTTVWAPVGTDASWDVSRQQVVSTALTGLDPSTTYRVFVRAVSSTQISPWSAPLLVQTAPIELRDVGPLDVGITSGLLYVAQPFTGAVRVIDPASGSTLRRFESLEGPTGLGLTPDERRLVVTGAVTGTMAVLNAGSGALERVITLPANDPSTLNVIDDRYAVVSLRLLGSFRVDILTGTVTPISFVTSAGATLDAAVTPLRVSRSGGFALLERERFRFVDGVPQALGSSTASSLDARPSLTGAAWLDGCTILDAQLLPVRTFLDGCVRGAIADDGSRAYRMDWTRPLLEVLDVASGTVAQAVALSAGGHHGVVSGQIVVLHNGVTSVTLVNPVRAAAQPPAKAPNWPHPAIPYGPTTVAAGYYTVWGGFEGTHLAASPSGALGGVGYAAEARPVSGGPSLVGTSADTVMMPVATEPMGYQINMWALSANGVRLWLDQTRVEVPSKHRAVVTEAGTGPASLHLRGGLGPGWKHPWVRVSATPAAGGAAVVQDLYPFYWFNNPDDSTFWFTLYGLAAATEYSVTVQPLAPDGELAVSTPFVGRTG